jgi:peptide-N4-(N-acetyl-beta-glucosaminyl)asparagine amidase
MGFDARYVLDWTDHVWTEVYSDYLGKWVHCDSCEQKFDAPLMYEAGWGKKLSYVIGFSPDGVVDVTKRYTQKYNDVLTRRNEVSEDWLKKTLNIINYQLSIFMIPDKLSEINQRSKEEEIDFSKNQIVNTDELEGRISGSTEWKESRGETGDKVVFDFSTLKLENEKFRFNSFLNASNVILVGDSKVEKNVIQLTSNKNSQAGAMWISKKQNLSKEFNILFQFRISINGADGFALVLQNDSEKVIGIGGGDFTIKLN